MEQQNEVKGPQKNIYQILFMKMAPNIVPTLQRPYWCSYEAITESKIN